MDKQTFVVVQCVVLLRPVSEPMNVCLDLCVCVVLGELLCWKCGFRAAGDGSCADGGTVHGTL